MRLIIALLALSAPVFSAPDTIAEFCPLEEGQTIRFDINLAVDIPSYQQFTQYWHTAAGTISRVLRREIAGPKSTDPYVLELRVGKQVNEPANYARMTGYTVEVVQDDLGIYNDVKEVYWAMKDEESPSYIAEICVFDAEEQGPANVIVEGDGKSIRPIYLVGKTRSSLWLGEVDNEYISYVGMMRDSRFLERQVDAPSDDKPAFVEKMTFRRGVGLTELEQLVDDRVTMSWSRVLDLEE